MHYATDKQISFILSLVNQITHETKSHLSQHKVFMAERFGLSSGQLARLKKDQASVIIDQLKSEV